MKPGTVIDIGGGNVAASMKAMIAQKMLHSSCCEDDEIKHNQCVLPSALLSDDKGLAIWKQINRLPNYYQTSEEISLLELNRWDIIQHIASGSVIIDLGMGDVRKVKPLLDALEQSQTRVDYYALDLSYNAIQSQISPLSKCYTYVRCFGLWGTFDDALRWNVSSPSSQVQRESLPPPPESVPRVFLSLGSILGNDWLSPAVAFLKTWSHAMRPHDRLLLAMDATSEPSKLWSSYHDAEGLFVTFIRNGMAHTNHILGTDWYKDEDWEVEGVMMDDPIMHRFVIRALRDVVDTKAGICFNKGDEVDCYEAFKYGPSIMRRQFAMAGLAELGCWAAPGSQIYEYLLAAEGCESDAQNTSNNNRYYVE